VLRSSFWTASTKVLIFWLFRTDVIQEEDIMYQSEGALDTGDGFRLFTQEWAPESGVKAVVCLVHGLGDHTGRYTHVAATLTENGYALAGYDLRGHGKSGGARGHTPSYDALMDDLALCLAKTQARYPGKPLFLYGHSLGGNQVLNFALRRQPAVTGVISTGPWLRLAFDPPALQVMLGKVMNSIYPSFAQANGLETAALSTDELVVKKYENDPLVHDRISARLFLGAYQAGYWALEHASDFSYPLLLMHGGADRLTSAQASREFAQKAGACCTLKIWEGFYHEIHNEPQQAEVMQVMVDWLEQKLPSSSESPESLGKTLDKSSPS
jgi:alpha-beta hydrolase superfamily lysophospholipase